jgi:hypothetical protein
MPYTGNNYGACFWEGNSTVCKILNSILATVEADQAAKQARGLPDGSVELAAEIPLRIFLDNQVISFPEQLFTRISEPMRPEPLTALIVLRAGRPRGGERLLRPARGDPESRLIARLTRLRDSSGEVMR